MLQFDILSGSKAGSQVVARRFPFTLGRSAEVDLQLVEPGVWDRHLEVDLNPKDKSFLLRPHPDARITVNDETVREGHIRNGDLLQVGSVKIRVGLTAPVQRTSYLRENAIWFFLAAVSAAQIAIIYFLSK